MPRWSRQWSSRLCRYGTVASLLVPEAVCLVASWARLSAGSVERPRAASCALRRRTSRGRALLMGPSERAASPFHLHELAVAAHQSGPDHEVLQRRVAHELRGQLRHPIVVTDVEHLGACTVLQPGRTGLLPGRTGLQPGRKGCS